PRSLHVLLTRRRTTPLFPYTTLFRSVVEDGGELRHLRSNLVGDGAPLGAGSLRRLLGEGGCDKGRDDAATALAGMRQHIPHEVRSEEHTSELQSRENLVCRLLLEKKK